MVSSEIIPSQAQLQHLGSLLQPAADSIACWTHHNKAQHPIILAKLAHQRPDLRVAGPLHTLKCVQRLIKYILWRVYMIFQATDMLR